MPDPTLVLIIIAVMVVVFLIFSGVRIVPQAHRYNIERLGRYRTTLQPGLNFIIPVVDRINSKLDIREQVFPSQPQPVSVRERPWPRRMRRISQRTASSPEGTGAAVASGSTRSGRSYRR